MNVDDLPPVLILNQDPAFIVRLVAYLAILGHAEHECVAHYGCITKYLRPGFPNVISEFNICSGPDIFDHKQVKGQPVLSMGSNKPLVERQIIVRGRSIGVNVSGEDALQVAMQCFPDFLRDVVHSHSPKIVFVILLIITVRTMPVTLIN